MRLLIVENDQCMGEVLSKRLKNCYTVDLSKDENSMEEFLASYVYELMILDAGMQPEDSLNVLNNIRMKGCTVPVILLGPKDSVEERIRGLDAGADDYMSKPFSLSELEARIRAVIRRTSGKVSNEIVVGDLSINMLSQKVKRCDKSLNLSKKEYDLLVYMAMNKGKVLTREQLEQSAWDSTSVPQSNIIDVYIKYLRKKVDENFDYALIHTVRGRGYCLECR